MKRALLVGFGLLAASFAIADTTFTYMAYNILQGAITPTSSFNSAQSNALAKIINFYHPDVLCFEEFVDTSTSGAENLIKSWVNAKLPYMGGNPGSSYYDYVGTMSDSYGLRQVIISKYPLSNFATYSDGLRGIVSARVNFNANDSFQVFEAHLKCCNSSSSATYRQQGAQVAATAMANFKAANPNVPYIMSGDLNEDESHPQDPLTSSYHPITTILSANLVNQLYYDCTGSYDTIGTFTGSSPARFDYVLPSDHNFYPNVTGIVINTVRMANCGTLPAGLQSSDSSTASDHCPVFATLKTKTTTTSVNYTGTVKLLGYIGSNSALAAIPIKLIVNGGTPSTIYLTPAGSNNGTFSVPAAANTNMTVQVKPQGYLSQSLTTIITSSGGSASFNGPFNTGLLPGDANGDNLIDDTDLLAVINNFLSTTAPAEDFNGDGIVDDTDLLSAINYFLYSGN